MDGEGGWGMEEGFGFQLDFQAGPISIPAAGKGMAVEGNLNLWGLSGIFFGQLEGQGAQS